MTARKLAEARMAAVALLGEELRIFREAASFVRRRLPELAKLWLIPVSAYFAALAATDIGVATLLYFTLCIPIAMGVVRAINAQGPAGITFMDNLLSKRFLGVAYPLLILLAGLMASFSFPALLLMGLTGIRYSSCVLSGPQPVLPVYAGLAVLAATVAYSLPYGFVLVDATMGERRGWRDVYRQFSGHRLTLLAWTLGMAPVAMAAVPFERWEFAAFLQSDLIVMYGCRLVRLLLWSAYWLVILLPYGLLYARWTTGPEGHSRRADLATP